MTPIVGFIAERSVAGVRDVCKSLKIGLLDFNISNLLYSHCPGAYISNSAKTARPRSGWMVR